MGMATKSSELRLIYPNRLGAINKTKIINDIDDVEDLLKECNDKILSERLIRTHDLSRKINVDSSLTLHKVVAIQITVQKLPLV